MMRPYAKIMDAIYQLILMINQSLFVKQINSLLIQIFMKYAALLIMILICAYQIILLY